MSTPPPHDQPGAGAASGLPPYPAPVPVTPGQLIAGRYELVSELGRGGMATVWRAHDRTLDRDVAVKLFSASTALPDAGARATAEVRLLAGLNHPNVVSVYDAVGTGPGSFDVLVMQLVEGRSLRARLDEGPLSPVDTARLGADLAAGLDHVHERGIVHRDLKPANVLLERTARGDRGRLVDFGVARLLEGSALTAVGTTVGTANYLSPEQATGVPIGPASDVYSLGLVLLECLTGVMAYPGHGVAAAAARLSRPPTIPAALDPGWQDLLRAMTAADPSARPSAGQVEVRLATLATDPGVASTPLVPAVPDGATALVGAEVESGSSGPLSGLLSYPDPDATDQFPVTTPPRHRHRRRRRGLLLPAVGVAAAALAVLLGLTLGGGEDPAPALTTPSSVEGTPTPGVAAGVSSSTPPRPTTSAPSTATAAARTTRTAHPSRTAVQAATRTTAPTAPRTTARHTVAPVAPKPVTKAKSPKPGRTKHGKGGPGKTKP